VVGLLHRGGDGGHGSATGARTDARRPSIRDLDISDRPREGCGSVSAEKPADAGRSVEAGGEPSPNDSQGEAAVIDEKARADRGPAGAHRRSDLYRRALDVAISLLLVVLTLPVLVVVTLISAVALRSWPLFVQDRVGRHGRTFRFAKVRTLPRQVPAYVDKHELARYEVPAVCQALRKLHLDELPQLVLVLLGRMSLVGPRPEMAHLHHDMGAFGVERTAVRPGCTGLWQVSESCTGLIGAAPQYDRFYLDHRSLRFDLWILYRTALKMTGLAAGVSLDQVPRWALPAEAEDARGLVLDLTAEPDGAASLLTSR